MPSARTRLTLILIVVAAASRLVAHAPNFTPLGAIALFGGAYFEDRRAGFLVPLAALFLTDLILGFYPGMTFVYASFAMTVLIGYRLRHTRSATAVAGATLGTAILFFIVTNFGVWLMGGLYPHSLGGLEQAYVSAIPFFRNSLFGDMAYAAVLFGGMALAERFWSGAARTREPVGLS
ncbi:MAG: hypothetical protein M0T84_10595 [Betaproteobacteria bacterium]|nr:hypothetical protein [Betaproteobacteria bacterium]